MTRAANALSLFSEHRAFGVGPKKAAHCIFVALQVAAGGHHSVLMDGCLQFSHIQELAHIRLLGTHRCRHGKRRRLDFTGNERHDSFRLAAGLNHGDIPLRIETVSLQSKPRCEIGQGAKARGTE
jgi:hypothetical protein